jgi:hypothetical protein
VLGGYGEPLLLLLQLLMVGVGVLLGAGVPT